LFFKPTNIIDIPRIMSRLAGIFLNIVKSYENPYLKSGQAHCPSTLTAGMMKYAIENNSDTMLMTSN
jgi:hypothetical protein